MRIQYKKKRYIFVLLGIMICLEILLIWGLITPIMYYDQGYIVAYSNWHYNPSSENKTALALAIKKARNRIYFRDGVFSLCIFINAILIFKTSKIALKQKNKSKK